MYVIADHAVSQAAVLALNAAVATIESQTGAFDVVVVCSRGTSFCLGADVHAQLHFTEASEARTGAIFLKAVLARLEALPIPTVAYFAGTALGGTHGERCR